MKYTTMNGRAFRAALLAGAASVLTFPAMAQQEAQGTLEEIVVTGSRIARTDLVANSPISVISFEALKGAGTVNVEDYLRNIPQAVAAIGGNTNNGNPGVATVDLRNLSEERTLVLVGGKRFVPYDSNGIVDLSMIPVSLIERVEVVTGGASAVYGSDAVAGVVNFIMKEDFEGAEFDGQFGITEKGDGDTVNFSSTVGGNFANGRGNIVFNAGYSDHKVVYQGDRAFSFEALASADFSPGGSFTAEEGTLLINAGPNTDEDGFAQFDANGNIVAPFQTYNFNPSNLLQAPQEKWTATTVGHYELTEDVEVFGRMSFANNRVKTIIASTGTFFFPFDINYATNPFLNAQARGVLAGEDTVAAGDANPGDGIITVAFGRRLTEMGTRDSIYENSAYQFVGGFRGDIGESYSWEVFSQYGRTLRTQTLANDFNYAKAQQALLAVAGPNGPECIDTSGGCAPANLFGKGNLSTAAADFIRFDLQQYDTTSQFVTGGSFAGDLPITLATTPVGFALGAEYRREQSVARPDDNLKSGNAPGFGAASPIDADYNVKEIFGETLIPLVEGAPMAESLSIDLGLRYSDYQSKVGTTENNFSNESYKIGGDWAPTTSFRFRGLYQRAVRAPNLNELGQPITFGTGDANTDPCQGQLPVGNAALTALCIATGVPANRIGSVAGPIVGQINNYSGGNPNLDPEKSDTYTVGAVFRPEAMPQFVASIDYYRINVKNAIITPTEQSILDACYTVELNATGPFCSRVLRNPLNGSLIGGTETGVIATSVNAAVYKAEGIDLYAAYAFDLGTMGELALDVNAAHVMKSVQQDASFLPANDCSGLVGETCLRPNPKWRWTQTTTWNYDALSLGLTWQYLSKVTKDTIAFGVEDPSDYVVPVIGATSYFDLTGTYELSETVQLRAGITNLLDNKPPVVGNDYGGTAENSGNTFPATYDPLGRAFFFGATTKF